MSFLRQYEEIISMRDISSAPKRGYAFEQILRELLPWNYRPPISVKTESEQIDAFFEWNSWHFLVEAKAKRNIIMAGSHDWEDFCLKVSRRKGQCIGMFCSLFDVHEEVIKQAKKLNEDGCISFIISGKIWDELFNHKINITDYVRFMVFQAKSKYVAHHSKMNEVESWSFNRSDLNKKIQNFCLKESSLFLRRHMTRYHESVYISRKVDNDLASYTRLLMPSKLTSSNKLHKHKGTETSIQRVKPKQIALVRDWSGAGKTTLSVNMALQNDSFFGITKAALQKDIDNFLAIMEEFDGNLAVTSLVYVDKPIVLIIDSLDEAINQSNKHREIQSLIKSLDKFNQIAQEYDLLCYPIMLVFTLREDFWREWEAYFEGIQYYNIQKRFSEFNCDEAKEALDKYSNSYNFEIANKLTQEQIKVLAHPFNLQIFSEAHQYDGSIVIDEIINETVLDIYFSRKKDDILKRPIPGFLPSILLSLCSNVAASMCLVCKNSISYTKLTQTIERFFPYLLEVADQVIRCLVSEQIIVSDNSIHNSFRFRHMRFIEYLVSYYISKKITQSDNPQELDTLTSKLIKNDFLSLYHIHEFIRYICKSEFPATYDNLTTHYANSSSYMKKLTLSKRAIVAGGDKVSNLDIDAIENAMCAGDPDLTYDGFFIIAAKNNGQSLKRILQAFEVAWKANNTRDVNWKMLQKLSKHRALLNPTVLSLLLTQGSSERDWYAFIDGIIENNQLNEFRDFVDSYCDDITKILRQQKGPGWSRVSQILEKLYSGECYELGA